MTPQFILRVAGIALLVIAALFAVLAVHYYLTQNIRAVMDDLSGKTRARGVAGTRTRSASERGRGVSRRPSRAAATPGQTASEAPVDEDQTDATPAAPMGLVPAFDDEDDVGTVLVAVSSAASAPAAMRDEDGTGTMLVDGTASTMGTTGPGAPAPVGASSGRTAGDGAAGALLHITRRVVMIHSQEVIAASEER